MSSSYTRFAGLSALLAGLAGLTYLISFFVLKNPAALVPATALLLVGVFASAALVGLYERVRQVDEGFALWGLLLGLGGAGGAAIHSAFDVATALHPAATPFGYASPIDPRGFLTFAVAGLASVVLSGLILRGQTLPHTGGYLGVVSGFLLIALYLAYLILLDPSNRLLLLLIVLSGLAQPIWYVWLGWQLWQAEAMAATRTRLVNAER